MLSARHSLSFSSAFLSAFCWEINNGIDSFSDREYMLQVPMYDKEMFSRVRKKKILKIKTV